MEQTGGNSAEPPEGRGTKYHPEYCKAHERPDTSDEERAVAGAGWIVVASFQGGNGVTIIGGAVSEDGMCRSDPYQHFVFVRGKFGGSLGLMRARSDGSWTKVSFPAAGGWSLGSAHWSRSLVLPIEHIRGRRIKF